MQLQSLYPVVGLIVGLIVGLTGVGGGSLMTPTLVFLFKVPLDIAIGTDLIFASLTKIAGVAAHGMRGNVNWRLVLALGMGSVPGAVLGGPVIIPKLYDGKNKTFFMFNYEGRRRREPGAISTALVPSDAMRNGDFSQLLNRRSATGAAIAPITIFDPLSSSTSPTPFPGNVIPSNRISPTAKALLDYVKDRYAIVSNNSRDTAVTLARKLARLLAGGLLEPLHVPSPELEAVRDLVRVREDARLDRMRDRHRLSKFCLRHGRLLPTSAWTVVRRRWLGEQRFEHGAEQITFDTYLHAVDLAAGKGARKGIDADVLGLDIARRFVKLLVERRGFDLTALADSAEGGVLAEQREHMQSVADNLCERHLVVLCDGGEADMDFPLIVFGAEVER